MLVVCDLVGAKVDVLVQMAAVGTIVGIVADLEQAQRVATIVKNIAMKVILGKYEGSKVVAQAALIFLRKLTYRGRSFLTGLKFQIDFAIHYNQCPYPYHLPSLMDLTSGCMGLS